MRIIHIASAMSWRGGEQQIIYLAKYQLLNGSEPFILCSTGSVLEQQCKVFNIPHATSRKPSGFAISFARTLHKITTKTQPDLIHIHDSHAHSAALTACRLFGLKRPLILSRRIDSPIRKSIYSQKKYNSNYINRIACVSHAIKAVIEPTITDHSKICVVHSGVDLSRFDKCTRSNKLHQEFNLDSTIKLVGNTSALADHKDYNTFLNVAVETLKKRDDIAFIIIGEGKDRTMIENRIKTEGIANKVFLTGYRIDIPEILPELDVFLMPSKTEGLGTSLLDALACKVPVVATLAGGIPEIIIHQQNGLLSDVADFKSLSQQVISLVDDSTRRAQMIANGTHKIEEFTATKMAENTLKTAYEPALAATKM
tara:strand:+ start:1825 stop:2931 length:1107 start_codon:yes stop_codon:yes gene_type:complete